MENQQQKQLTTKDFFSQEGVKKKFEELLGRRAPAFITSVLQTISSNSLLAKASPGSIYQAAAVAATLDLPINNSLGLAWIVPYKGQAQFQLGAKGFTQLALRTGQYKALNCISVHANQFTSYNELTEELIADFSIPGDGPIVGYAAYMEMLNGFKKTIYWSRPKVERHAKRFSKSFGSGPWATDFDAMAQKTVMKHLLSKWGMLSIEMQTALITDQAVVKNAETNEVDYVDVDAEVISKEEERWILLINDAQTLEDLYTVSVDMPSDNVNLQDAFNARKTALTGKEEVGNEAK